LEVDISAIELDLFAAMLDHGNLDPIHKGWISDKHLLTKEGKALWYFLKNYRQMTGGMGRIPSRSIVLQRFGPSVELPETMGTEDLKSLAYEVRLSKTRSDLRMLSENAQIVSDMADPMPEMHKLRRALDVAMEEISGGDDLAYGSAIDDILVDYDAGMLLPEGLPWPWPSMTKATRGLHKGEFIVICGRPKARKTFVALSVGANAFLEYGARVLFVSPEMPNRQIMLRWAATISKLRYAEFKASDLSEEEERRLIEDASRFRKQPIEVVGAEDNEFCMSGTTAEDIPPGTEPIFVVTKGTGKGLGYIATKIEEYRPDLVIVDSFYRLHSGDSRTSDPDWKAVTMVSRGLKDLASIEDGVIIVATHQLNRKADEGLGSLSNLALSDAVAQDADLVARVITARRKTGPDKSGIIVLGGRETPIEGVLIRNVPCSDYTEIEEITNQKKVLALLTEEEKQHQDEEKKESSNPKMGDSMHIRSRKNPMAVSEATRATKKKKKKAKKTTKDKVNNAKKNVNGGAITMEDTRNE
jgi:KaiC/GvpD/RAD55 family RecA-like ATPase